MSGKYYIEDESIMVEALSCKNVDYVWKEYVESCEFFEERIYWRNLFFDCLTWFSPLLHETLPKGLTFVRDIEEWINTF